MNTLSTCIRCIATEGSPLPHPPLPSLWQVPDLVALSLSLDAPVRRVWFRDYVCVCVCVCVEVQAHVYNEDSLVPRPFVSFPGWAGRAGGRPCPRPRLPRRRVWEPRCRDSRTAKRRET